MKSSISGAFQSNGAAQESNLPSRGLHDRTGFEGPRERVAGVRAPLRDPRFDQLLSDQVRLVEPSTPPAEARRHVPTDACRGGAGRTRVSPR
jgi:hypothetical protein